MSISRSVLVVALVAGLFGALFGVETNPAEIKKPAITSLPKLSAELRDALQSRDFAAAVKLIDAALAEADPKLAVTPGDYLLYLKGRAQTEQDQNDAALETSLAKLAPEVPPSDRTALVRVAEGSLGLALRLASGDGLALARDAQGLIEARGAPDIPAILAMGDCVARASDGLAHFGQFLAQALALRIRARAAGGEDGLEEAVASWERVNALFGRAVGLHMEPRQTVLSAALTVQSSRAIR